MQQQEGKFFDKLYDARGHLDRIFLTSLFWCVSVLIFTLVIYFLIPNICDRYFSKFQVAMFAGFLTLGSFLLTLKTFVVVQFKTQLFEQEPYRQVFTDSKTQKNYVQGDYYQPLADMAKLLLLAVIASLGTSFTQITIGFIHSNLISAFCMALGIATLLIVGFSWWVVRRNTLMMIRHWEVEAMKKVSLREE